MPKLFWGRVSRFDRKGTLLKYEHFLAMQERH